MHSTFTSRFVPFLVTTLSLASGKYCCLSHLSSSSHSSILSPAFQQTMPPDSSPIQISSSQLPKDTTVCSADDKVPVDDFSHCFSAPNTGRQFSGRPWLLILCLCSNPFIPFGYCIDSLTHLKSWLYVESYFWQSVLINRSRDLLSTTKWPRMQVLQCIVSLRAVVESSVSRAAAQFQICLHQMSTATGGGCFNGRL
jgi:hypothetical protein